MRQIPLLLLVLAGCATTADDLRKMPTAEVCYIGMTEPEHRQMADAELKRRNDDCISHRAEIANIQAQQARLGGGAAVEGLPQPSSGGMGRGY